jgi:hypothetical protein
LAGLAEIEVAAPAVLVVGAVAARLETAVGSGAIDRTERLTSPDAARAVQPA